MQLCPKLQNRECSSGKFVAKIEIYSELSTSRESFIWNTFAGCPLSSLNFKSWTTHSPKMFPLKASRFTDLKGTRLHAACTEEVILGDFRFPKQKN